MSKELDIKSKAIKKLSEKLGVNKECKDSFWENMSPEEVDDALNIIFDPDLSVDEMYKKLCEMV